MSETASTFIIFLLLIFIAFLMVTIILKNLRVKKVEAAFSQMKKAFTRLDEQAKLIVKTDLELNKAQEESERRLHLLEALQKTSRLISTTLDENEIYNRIGSSLMNEFGFDKNLILGYKAETLTIQVSSGFTDDETAFIQANFLQDKELVAALNSGQNFSSVTAATQRHESIKRIFGLNHFVLAPVVTQNGILGYIFIGNTSNANPITEGDEELISIFSNQIGQSIENARLYEQVFRSQQDLETKIQDRTNQLEKALKDVQAINKAKSEFISAVSHELRTPLTSIKGYAGLLMQGKLGEIPQAVFERLEKINKHTDSLVQLINNLLDISRIESGRTTMNMSNCQLKDVVSNVHDLLTPQLRERQINWTENIPQKLPELMLDESQIERIFINLASNAIKFTPPDGTINVTMMLNEDHIKTEVSDTGIGINEDDLLKLFNEFYRVENEINMSVKGTGLGLPLAKKIVEAHGGKMWVTSKVNEGTTFHFTLPLKNNPPASETTV